MTTAADKPDPTEGGRFCGAWARTAQRPCRKPSGWGTSHNGSGRCRYHGGCSPGAPGNKNNLRHGLAAMRVSLSALRVEIQARIAEAQADRNPLDPAALAADYLEDSQRLLARLALAEQRIDELAEGGALDAQATVAGWDLVLRCERAIAATRAGWSALVSRFPARVTTPEPAEAMGLAVDLGGRVATIVVQPGASLADMRSCIPVDDRPPDPESEDSE